jgi:HlyD family secretion protein
MWINDLKKLAARDTTSIFEEISVSPTYSEQYQHLLFQLRSNRDAYKKAARELAIDANLYADKVITQREFEDKKIAVSELQMTFSRLIKRQQAAWLEESQNWQIKLNALKLKAQQFEKDKKMSDIYSPITGSVQGMTGKYIGQFVQAGEFFATISPDSILIVECLVYPKDIAFVRKNQKAFIQIDAFNYNQWGFLEGKVMDIAEDFTLIDGLPTFKVRCALDRDFLALRNGFKGKLKKGMTVRTRFIVTERSLFQLLYDKIDNWLNPLQ